METGADPLEAISELYDRLSERCVDDRSRRERQLDGLSERDREELRLLDRRFLDAEIDLWEPARRLAVELGLIR